MLWTKKLSIRLSAKGKKRRQERGPPFGPDDAGAKGHSLCWSTGFHESGGFGQAAGRAGASGQAGGTDDCHEKVGPFSLKGMAAAWVKPDWPRQTPGDPLLPWWRLYQRKFGIFPASRFQADQCHWMGDPVL